jgi:hypothetical protein
MPTFCLHETALKNRFLVKYASFSCFFYALSVIAVIVVPFVIGYGTEGLTMVKKNLYFSFRFLGQRVKIC